MLSSTQIVIKSLNFQPQLRPKNSTLASSLVLDTLLPELSIWQTNKVRQPQILENIDAYMLLETKQMLDRIATIYSNLALTNTMSFNLKLQFSDSTINLSIDEDTAAKQTFIKQLKLDKWLAGAFEWLCPNYTALAHSQELISFSYAYAKNNQEALRLYQHFKLPEQGMCCYLVCKVEQGEPNLTWSVASPQTKYLIKELQPKS